VGLAKLSSGKMQEGFKSQSSSMGSIEIFDDIVNKLVASREPKANKSIFKLDRIDNATSVAIKDVKSSLDLFNFFN
jgi:hypothetical protein